MCAARTIVLTGGDYSGKTTLLETFRDQGHAVVPEAALRVLAELNREHGVDGQSRWRAQNWTRWQARVARRQLALEVDARAIDAGALFFDRGLPDGIAFCRQRGVEVPAELTFRAARPRYDAVVLLDTVEPFDPRSHTGRLGDAAQSRELCDLLQQVYEELGYCLVRLPQLTLAERIERIRALID